MDEATLNKLREEARKALAQGKSIEEIKQSLRNAGFSEEEIEEILKGLWGGGGAPRPAQAAAASGINPMLIIGIIAVIAIIAAVVFMGGGGGPAVPESRPPTESAPSQPSGYTPPETVIVPPDTGETTPPTEAKDTEGPWRTEAPERGPIPPRCAEKELKDDCIEQEAIEAGDAGICAAFINEDSWRDWDLPHSTMEKTYRDSYSQCVENVAIDQLDTEVCKEVVGSFFFTECVNNIAQETLDAEDCDILKYSDRTYVSCIYMIATNTQDTSLCEDIKGLTTLSRETCYYRIADYTNDPSYCEPLQGSSMYEACMAKV